MKIEIDLGTVDLKIQRNDGTWEKIDHARTKVQLDGSLLRIDTVIPVNADIRSEVAAKLRSYNAGVTNNQPRILRGRAE